MPSSWGNRTAPSSVGLVIGVGVGGGDGAGVGVWVGEGAGVGDGCTVADGVGVGDAEVVGSGESLAAPEHAPKATARRIAINSNRGRFATRGGSIAY